MRIVLIGAGNVATRLATELYKHQHRIVQVYSRTYASANILADEIDAQPVTNIGDITSDADIYIFSVKDSVLEELVSHLPPNKGLWIHTAGSMPLSIFGKYTERSGVLYPFQTLSKSKDIDWKSIPIFVEASGENALKELLIFAKTLSTNVIELSSEKRKYVHLTGVYACNFVNYMYTLSADTLEKAGLPFELVLPLIDETCRKIHTLSPIDAQTGPAVRFDRNVIDKHLALIEDKQVKDMYRMISEQIHKIHQNKSL